MRFWRPNAASPLPAVTGPLRLPLPASTRRGCFSARIGAPLIKLESVSYLADGTPLEYYSALHRGDRTRFEVELVRIEGKGEVVELLRGL